MEELESAGTRDPKWLIDRAKAFLDAGAYVCSVVVSHIIDGPYPIFAQMIMIESEGITENVKNWRTDVISAVTSALPAEKIMYAPPVFHPCRMMLTHMSAALQV